MSLIVSFVVIGLVVTFSLLAMFIIAYIKVYKEQRKWDKIFETQYQRHKRELEERYRVMGEVIEENADKIIEIIKK